MSKFVERQMICTALARLEKIAPMSEYRYIGFGAMYFIDFRLFHRQLGLESMISIERNTSAKERYLFNRPYSGVEILFGDSSEILTELEWSELSIVWLDFDGQLGHEQLRQVEYLAQRLIPGSVLIVTLNARAKFGQRRQTLLQNLGPELIGDELSEENMKGAWAFANAQREILSSVVDHRFSLRGDGATGRQIFNFVYKDGSPMQTLGWIVESPATKVLVDSCRFEDLDFVRPGVEPCDVTAPQLTPRERVHLESMVPTPDPAEGRPAWIERGDFARFASLYRWYPEPA